MMKGEGEQTEDVKAGEKASMPRDGEQSQTKAFRPHSNNKQGAGDRLASAFAAFVHLL